MAALWLQSGDFNEHELARIGTIVEEWKSLSEPLKAAIEAIVISSINIDIELMGRLASIEDGDVVSLP